MHDVTSTIAHSTGSCTVANTRHSPTIAIHEVDILALSTSCPMRPYTAIIRTPSAIPHLQTSLTHIQPSQVIHYRTESFDYAFDNGISVLCCAFDCHSFARLESVNDERQRHGATVSKPLLNRYGWVYAGANGRNRWHRCSMDRSALVINAFLGWFLSNWSGFVTDGSLGSWRLF